jgi:hypothetical protein
MNKMPAALLYCLCAFPLPIAWAYGGCDRLFPDPCAISTLHTWGWDSAPHADLPTPLTATDGQQGSPVPFSVASPWVAYGAGMRHGYLQLGDRDAGRMLEMTALPATVPIVPTPPTTPGPQAIVVQPAHQLVFASPPPMAPRPQIQAAYGRAW